MGCLEEESFSSSSHADNDKIASLSPDSIRNQTPPLTDPTHSDSLSPFFGAFLLIFKTPAARSFSSNKEPAAHNPRLNMNE